MQRQFREGEVFGQYLLDRKISESGSRARWVATHQPTGDRVCLTLLDPVDDQTWQAICNRVSRLRGLLHENINPASAAETVDDIQVLVEPYFRGGNPLELPGGPTAGDWPVIRQLLGAAAYVHSLGITHGDIHPGNILVDDAGTVRLTGFAASVLPEEQYDDYRSQQVKAGADADVADDIYALGQVIFRLLTGKIWRPDVEIDTPLPEVPAQMLRRMLSENSLDRQVDLQDMLEALTRHFEKPNQGIESVGFKRAGTSGEQHSTAAMPVRGGDGMPLPVVMGGLLVIVVLGILLFLLLPGDGGAPATSVASGSVVQAPATSSDPGPAPAEAPAAPAITPMEAARMEHLEKEGERIGREILKTQITLEDSGVSLWASADYQDLVTRLDEADLLYREQKFDEAFAEYEAVLSGLQALADSREQVLAEQIERGDEALAAGEPREAMTAFTIATRLEPGDRGLARKLERAENLDEVMRLTNEAEIHERNGELEQARSAFTGASQLDPDWGPASEGLARIKASIQQRDFRRAMSRGFQGIAAGDYAAARAGFNDARKIRPGSPEPADGLLQVEQVELSDRISKHRETAEQAMTRFDWQAAVAAYDAALAISPSLEFALKGKAVAESRLELEQRLDEFLADPTVLQSDDAYADAAALIREASRLQETPATFQRDLNTIAQLVSAARIEIPVTIRSNGSTHVTVRKFRELGRISSETVYLVPGKYTIVGERPGYRDVREELVLLPGEPAPVITVASDERVR